VLRVPVERIEIVTETSDLKGLRILHLSDLHLSARHCEGDLERLVERINGTNPDLVAITGDLIDTTVGRVRSLIPLLGAIEAPTFFVSGNHDQVYGYRALVVLLEEAGITVLDSRRQRLRLRNREIEVAGLPDRFAPFFGRRRSFGHLGPGSRREVPLIFLAHQPKDYRHALRAGSDLFLCGHTHGGQIWPFHWLVRLSQPFLEGLHQVEGMAVFVSRGVGTWGIHRRFRAPAQLPLIVMV